MAKTKKHIMLNLDLELYLRVKAEADKVSLPVSTYVRTVLVKGLEG